MTEDGQVYEHVEEMTEDGQKYEHNKIFQEQCGIKHETITVVSLLFINLVIHCNRLALRNYVFSAHFVYDCTIFPLLDYFTRSPTWGFIFLCRIIYDNIFISDLLVKV